MSTLASTITFVSPYHISGPWRHALKLSALHKYLQSGNCKSKYILYLDSDDVILRGCPSMAIELLGQCNAQLLFSGTSYVGAYELMPDAYTTATNDWQRHAKHPLYLNSGVYVGSTKFLRQVIADAVEFFTPDDISTSAYKNWQLNGTLCENLKNRSLEFPYGVGCDQEILRFVQVRYADEMKVDYHDRLALR